MEHVRLSIKKGIWNIFGPLRILQSVEDGMLLIQAIVSKKHQLVRERKAHRRAFYGQFIQPGSLCFDVGANFGNRIEPFLHNGARVVAIEPQFLPVQYLQLKYGHHPRVIVVPKGLAAQEGEATLYIASSHTASSMSEELVNIESHKVSPISFDGRIEVVSVTTLDSLIAEYGVPDFLKIDVEGFEYEVLRGLTTAVPQLSFEYKPDLTETSVLCIEYLSQIGEYEYNYSSGESMIFEMENWLPSADILRLIRGQFAQKTDSFGDIYARLRTLSHISE